MSGSLLKSEYISLLEVFGGIGVVFLHFGLSLLEAGRSNSKNVASALTRQLACLLLSISVYWLVGYAFTFGGEHFFIGYGRHFALHKTENSSFSHFFLHAAVASLPSSILGGAVAERTHFTGHLVLCLLLTGVVGPIVGHWVWDKEGWLFTRGCMDYAGVLPTHVLSGTLALLGCCIAGRRIQKFGDNYKVRIEGHSLPLAAVGGSFMIIGMVGKSIGLTAHDLEVGIGKVTMNCFLSASAAGTLTLLLYKFSVCGNNGFQLDDLTHNKQVKITNRRWSYFCCVNGCIAGLAAVQGGVGSYPPWAAWVVGFVAGAIYFIISRLMVLCRFDDATDAVAVHLGAGFWGAFAAPLLTERALIMPGEEQGLLVGWAAAGIGATFLWTAATSGALLLMLLLVGKLRVETMVETIGADVFKVEEQAYPTVGKRQFDATVGNIIYQVKTTGISPKSQSKRRPFELLPNRSINLTHTAIVNPCYLGENMCSTQKLGNIELDEFSRSLPRIFVDEIEKTFRLTVDTSSRPPPPSTLLRGRKGLPSITVAPPNTPVTPVNPVNTLPSLSSPGRIVLSVTNLRDCLKKQKNCLKPNGKKTPSMQRNPDESSSSNVSINTEAVREIVSNRANFNYLDIAVRKSSGNEKQSKEKEEQQEINLVQDDVFENDENVSASADVESGFGDSSTQLQGLIDRLI